MPEIQLRRLGYSLGAEIVGLDLAQRLDEATISQVRAGVLDHVVLCFPNQRLDVESLRRFAQQFGELDDHRREPHSPHPDDTRVQVIANKQISIGGRTFKTSRQEIWHTDHAHTVQPDTFGFLFATELPDVGGETMFANAMLAYEALSPSLQRLVDGLEGIQDVSMGVSFQNSSPEAQAQRLRLTPPVAHPVVRIHPETGRKALYLGEFVRNFAGMTEEESTSLRDYLNRHITRYEFVYRHRWRLGDLVMWDNRSALHYAVQDFDSDQTRCLLKCNAVGGANGRVPATLPI